jgi:hypothetical protein
LFRSVTSVVSALSGFGANGHQTMQHVSSSPSKIPYDGFSPVRLQAGSPLRPSTSGAGLSARSACPSHSGALYAAQVLSSASNGPARAAATHCSSRSRPYGQAAFEPVDRAFQPRGPLLSRGLCCPTGSSLLWPHLRLSAPPAGLSSSSRRVSCPSISSRRGSERVPNLLRVSLLSCHLPYPGGPSCCIWLLLRSRLWSYAYFAKARHPQSCARRFPRRSCHEAAEFALCYGPNRSLALHRQGRLHPSFRLSGSPPSDVGYDYMANNQFPWPNFHRLDTRPYGLQTKARNDENTKFRNKIVNGTSHISSKYILRSRSISCFRNFVLS